jgi:hypothetical protein
MKLVFGIASLLIALAIVGTLASTQLAAVRGSSAAPAGDATASVPEQSRRLQEQVATDVTKALEQGAAARREASGQ